ncbi:hypothetical protein ROA7023_01223 [Roseisalinus antarcticus]|uniref:DUF302 domain-containing protein n=2 Tax=Roseisalinus antarcticus TaxID=254357 RepID=A0A1Y5SAQ5_9RHOB|nr:hypothetical protein ROA7023_01223 [Roseisalinus antarcticus]
MKTLGIVAALLLPAGMAAAEGWTISDLGSEAEREICMNKAAATFSSFAMKQGIEEVVGQSEWTVAGYDLRGSGIDSIIICPIEGGLVAPFLLTYSSDNDADARQIIHDRVVDAWNSQ